MAFPILSAISSCYSSFYSWLTSSSSFSDSSGFFFPKYPASSRSFLSCLRASQDSTVLGRGGVRYPYDILALISISGSFCHYCSTWRSLTDCLLQALHLGEQLGEYLGLRHLGLHSFSVTCNGYLFSPPGFLHSSYLWCACVAFIAICRLSIASAHASA